MKRFHVHLAVPEIDAGVAFYSKMFGSEPTVTKGDYAKWMLDDPRINFAISTRGETVGLNHLGMQVDEEAELLAMREQAEHADLAVLDEPDAACCYSRSDKHWITDPAGIAWEAFRTLEEIPVFGESRPVAAAKSSDSGCCPSSAPATPAKVSCCG